MVKGAVEEQQTEGGQGGKPLVVAGVEPHREVEHHRHQVEQENFLHLPPQGGKGPPALENLAQDKLAGYHEKEGDRHPGQTSGEQEVPVRGVGGQRGGVDGHHQQSGDDLEDYPCARLHSVMINPSTLFPEMVQGRSESRLRIVGPSEVPGKKETMAFFSWYRQDS